MRAFTLVFVHRVRISSVRDQRRALRAMKIVRVYCTNASLSGARTRTRFFARVHVNLRPASCSHENVPSSSSSDSQATVDDASSRTSRSESSLSLALPSLRRLVPLFLFLHLLIVLFPSFSFSRSLSFTRSFTLAALTNAGYNSIVGHDPQAALTPTIYLASSMTN